jgi:hypothetical protein
MSGYAYQAGRFSLARSTLMLPHPHGEAAAIAEASRACSLALTALDLTRFDEDVRHWIETLQGLIRAFDCRREAPAQQAAVADAILSDAEKREFSNIIDLLADWFNLQFWAES